MLMVTSSAPYAGGAPWPAGLSGQSGTSSGSQRRYGLPRASQAAPVRCPPIGYPSVHPGREWVPMTMDDGQSGAWLSLRDAARQLGLSDKTIRRRVKAGTLQARQAATLHGPAWEVWVDAGVPGMARVDGE